MLRIHSSHRVTFELSAKCISASSQWKCENRHIFTIFPSANFCRKFVDWSKFEIFIADFIDGDNLSLSHINGTQTRTQAQTMTYAKHSATIRQCFFPRLYLSLPRFDSIFFLAHSSQSWTSNTSKSHTNPYRLTVCDRRGWKSSIKCQFIVCNWQRFSGVLHIEP